MIRKTFSLLAMCGLTFMASCGSTTSTTDSTEVSESSVAESTENEATWVINAPGDAFSAAAAQTVCDLMRVWAPPVETSDTQVMQLQKYTDSLRKLIGSPSDALYGGTHVTILGHSEALLANEAEYPTDEVMPASFGWIEGACDDLGLTPENSKYGLKD